MAVKPCTGASTIALNASIIRLNASLTFFPKYGNAVTADDILCENKETNNRTAS